MTNLEASKIVVMLFAAWPQGEKQTDETVRVYEEMLKDLDFENAKAAIARLSQTSTFLPAIAEVRAAARDLRIGQRRTGLEGWGDVTKAISLVGSYRSPTFDDPLVAHVVRCLGWRELCLGDNESALRARFVEAYNAIADRELREEAVSEPLRLQAPSAPGMAQLKPAVGTAGEASAKLMASLRRSP